MASTRWQIKDALVGAGSQYINARQFIAVGTASLESHSADCRCGGRLKQLRASVIVAALPPTAVRYSKRLRRPYDLLLTKSFGN